MKLKYLDISAAQLDNVHGRHFKDLAICHETVSPDMVGLADILSISNYLDQKDYGIHGLTDAEGNIAWAHGLGDAIFWQAGGVNQRGIGIEQISRVMLQSPSNKVRKAIWLARDKELRATAKLLAAIHNTRDIPLVYSDGTKPGVTSHWDVSQHFSSSQGHTDCWPVHKGGYYPMLYVIYLARGYALTGLTL